VRLRLTASNCSLEIAITVESPVRKSAWPILVSVYVQLNLLRHSAEIRLNSFRKSLAISRQKSSHSAVLSQFQHFAFSIYHRRGSSAIRMPFEVLFFRESRVRSFLRNFVLLVFPSFVLSLYPFRKMILQLDSDRFEYHVFYFLISVS